MEDKKWWEKDYLITKRGDISTKLISDYTDFYQRFKTYKDGRYGRRRVINQTKKEIDKALRCDFSGLTRNSDYGTLDWADNSDYHHGGAYIKKIGEKKGYSTWGFARTVEVDNSKRGRELPIYMDISKSTASGYDVEISVDISKYLASKGNLLFEVIEKAFNPKITFKNYKTTTDEMLKVQNKLLKALEYQKELMDYRFENGEISKSQYDKYLASYKENKVYAGLVAESWTNKEKEIDFVKCKDVVRKVRAEKFKESLKLPIVSIKKLHTENKQKRLERKAEKEKIAELDRAEEQQYLNQSKKSMEEEK